MAALISNVSSPAGTLSGGSSGMKRPNSKFADLQAVMSRLNETISGSSTKHIFSKSNLTSLLPQRRYTNCTTTHESSRSSGEEDGIDEEDEEEEEEDEDGIDEEDEEEEEEDEEDEDLDEEEDGEDDEDYDEEEEEEDFVEQYNNDEINFGSSAEGAFNRDAGRPKEQPLPRMPIKVSASTAAKVLPDLKDHNDKHVKIPKSISRYKPYPSPPASLNTGRKGTSFAEDKELFESIKSKYDNSAPKPSTVFVSRLPEPSQIRAATKQSRINAEKRKPRDDLQSPFSKKQRQEDFRRKFTVFEWENSRTESGAHRQDTGRENCPLSLPRRPATPPPIEEDRVIMQFTVFRTKQLPSSFDGNLTGKTIRSGTFVDKNRANKLALSLLSKPNPAVARIELDYGTDESSRNGMFFGRAEFKDGTSLYVYVDCEYQQYGKIDPSEFDGKRIHPQFKELCLAPRYDVFVFLRKPMTVQDGVVYEFEEEQRREAVVEEVDDDEVGEDDDDDDDENDTASKHGNQIDDPEIDADIEAEFMALFDECEHGQDNPDEEKGNSPVAESPKNDNEKLFGDRGDDGHTDESNSVEDHDQIQDRGEYKDKAPPPVQKNVLGSHFEHHFEGSYTTLAQAYGKALDAFTRWTRPKPPARMDAINYYRHTLLPFIEDLRRQFCEDQDSRDAAQGAEIPWEPSPQFRYDYEAINVVVVKSETQGPLDLTGAFL